MRDPRIDGDEAVHKRSLHKPAGNGMARSPLCQFSTDAHNHRRMVTDLSAPAPSTVPPYVRGDFQLSHDQEGDAAKQRSFLEKIPYQTW